MKKVLYAALMLLSTTFMVTSCGDDDENSQSYSQTPATNIQGTYTGQLVASYIDPTTSAEVVTTEAATINITASQTYVIDIQLASTTINKQGKANVSTTSSGYPFNNKSTDAANTFGVPFVGEVLGNVCTLEFSQDATVMVGRRPRVVTTSYKFNGTK